MPGFIKTFHTESIENMLHRQCLSAQIQKFHEIPWNSSTFLMKLDISIVDLVNRSISPVISPFKRWWAPLLHELLELLELHACRAFADILPYLARLGPLGVKKPWWNNDETCTSTWLAVIDFFLWVFHGFFMLLPLLALPVPKLWSYAQAMQGTCRGLPLSSLPTAVWHLSRWQRWQLQGAGRESHPPVDSYIRYECAWYTQYMTEHRKYIKISSYIIPSLSNPYVIGRVRHTSVELFGGIS